MERNIAYYLDPSRGRQSLIFADDPNRVWMVKCAGKIEPEEYATWLKFSIIAMFLAPIKQS